ncbi:MAG TPA: aminoacyl-tRNA deacylase [Thermoanaerobaculia bacterium]|nr:aminoacyl-tRNA deacylase [Thermoanaerobaculia bacterium]
MPATAAVRVLRAAGVAFEPRFYAYVERGGTRHSAEALGVPEHEVVKTLVMEARRGGPSEPFLILMHGDREVSTKQLARQIGAREVAPASPAAVEKHTGYVPGGVSPFGTRKALPVHVERSILALPRVLVNGGRRGFLVALEPSAFTAVLSAIPVDVAIEP